MQEQIDKAAELKKPAPEEKKVEPFQPAKVTEPLPAPREESEPKPPVTVTAKSAVVEPAPAPAAEPTQPEDVLPPLAKAKPEPEPATQALAAANPSLDVPAFIKQDRTHGKEKVVVEKGRIISHYEDDMEVPTFLRKQMQ